MEPNQILRTAFALLLACALAIVTGVPALADKGAIPQRSDIDDEYKWDLSDMYASNEAWEAEFDFLERSLSAFDAYKGHLVDSPEQLLACLRLKDSLGIINDNLYVYANLMLDQDQRADEQQEMAGRASALYARFHTAVSFIRPEIIGLSGDRLQSSLKTTPELDLYRFYLEDLARKKKHVLSPQEEEILALADQVTRTPKDIFNMTNNADVAFGPVVDEEGNEVELTRQRYRAFLKSPDRRVRRDANRVYTESFLKHENTLAATLAGSIKNDQFYTSIRKFNTCLERALDSTNIPPPVFHNLIEATNANLTPLHKWTAIRKRILGYDTFYTYDLGAPLLDKKPREYSYEEAGEIVLAGLKPMGQKYLADFEKGLDAGWIDVYETQGKRSGAYNWGTYTSPPYVLLNYNNRLNNVFTLAHEMGHAMNTFYVNKNEPYIYSDYSIFTAEVASTVNEALLMKHMLGQAASREEKIELLIQYIEQIVNTFYTQVMFSEFELAMHERIEQGGDFSADYMRQTYRDIYQKYWGPELVIDSINDMGCLRISHFYRQFYVYKYATSYAAAQVLSQKIMDKEPGTLEAYLDFLETGCSKYPVDVLRDAGVDMTTPEPVNRTVGLFAELVDEVERLLDKK